MSTEQEISVSVTSFKASKVEEELGVMFALSKFFTILPYGAERPFGICHCPDRTVGALPETALLGTGGKTENMYLIWGKHLEDSSQILKCTDTLVVLNLGSDQWHQNLESTIPKNLWDPVKLVAYYLPKVRFCTCRAIRAIGVASGTELSFSVATRGPSDLVDLPLINWPSRCESIVEVLARKGAGKYSGLLASRRGPTTLALVYPGLQDLTWSQSRLMEKVCGHLEGNLKMFMTLSVLEFPITSLERCTKAILTLRPICVVETDGEVSHPGLGRRVGENKEEDATRSQLTSKIRDGMIRPMRPANVGDRDLSNVFTNIKHPYITSWADCVKFLTYRFRMNLQDLRIKECLQILDRASNPHLAFKMLCERRLAPSYILPNFIYSTTVNGWVFSGRLAGTKRKYHMGPIATKQEASALWAMGMIYSSMLLYVTELRHYEPLVWEVSHEEHAASPSYLPNPMSVEQRLSAGITPFNDRPSFEAPREGDGAGTVYDEMLESAFTEDDLDALLKEIQSGDPAKFEGMFLEVEPTARPPPNEGGFTTSEDVD